MACFIPCRTRKILPSDGFSTIVCTVSRWADPAESLHVFEALNGLRWHISSLAYLVTCRSRALDKPPRPTASWVPSLYPFGSFICAAVSYYSVTGDRLNKISCPTRSLGGYIACAVRCAYQRIAKSMKVQPYGDTTDARCLLRFWNIRFWTLVTSSIHRPEIEGHPL